MTAHIVKVLSADGHQKGVHLILDFCFSFVLWGTLRKSAPNKTSSGTQSVGKVRKCEDVGWQSTKKVLLDRKNNKNGKNNKNV